MVEQTIRPTVLLFDVNETLLDLVPLSESINAVLPDERAAKLWFTTMLQYSLVMTVSEQHAALPNIGAAVLEMMAKNMDVVLTSEEAKWAWNQCSCGLRFPMCGWDWRNYSSRAFGWRH